MNEAGPRAFFTASSEAISKQQRPAAAADVMSPGVAPTKVPMTDAAMHPVPTTWDIMSTPLRTIYALCASATISSLPVITTVHCLNAASSAGNPFQIRPYMPGVNAPGAHVQTRDPCDLRAVPFNDAYVRMIKQFKAFFVPERGRSGAAYIQHHRDIAAVCRTCCNLHALDEIGGECADVQHQGRCQA